MNDLIIRFWQHERYDPLIDAEVIRLVASTPKGSWHTEFELPTASALRVKREAFQQYVYGALASNLDPCEVVIG